MEGKISLLMLALLATNVVSMPEGKLKRNYNENEQSGPNGYEIGSEERDASIEDSVPCALFDNSGSREHGYDPHEHQNHGYRKGVSTSVKAAAAASASSYS
ncbi:uncharacterized protein [Epargyreus clarus]|uniref:uncharacterized protein n=1 Tax=Epargyreus clarus TaxID=520877 RepID=UPI003C2CA32B